MKVFVKLYATLTRSVSGAILTQNPQGIRAGHPFEVEMPEGSTIEDLVTYLALPRELVKVIFVNARAQKPDYRLQPGDELGIFPPIAGG